MYRKTLTLSLIGLIAGASSILLYNYYINEKDNSNLVSNDTVHIEQNKPTTESSNPSVLEKDTQKQIDKEKKDKEIASFMEERKRKYIEDFQKKKRESELANHTFEYTDEDKKEIIPYSIIDEDTVGWNISETPQAKNDLEITHSYPIELDFDLMVGGFKSGKVKEFKMLRANQEDFMSYSNCKIEYHDSWSYIYCHNGAKGYLRLTKFLSSNYVEGVFSYRGIAEIIKVKNNKGYIYGAY